MAHTGKGRVSPAFCRRSGKFRLYLRLYFRCTVRTPRFFEVVNDCSKKPRFVPNITRIQARTLPTGVPAQEAMVIRVGCLGGRVVVAREAQDGWAGAARQGGLPARQHARTKRLPPTGPLCAQRRYDGGTRRGFRVQSRFCAKRKGLCIKRCAHPRGRRGLRRGPV